MSAPPSGSVDEIEFTPAAMTPAEYAELLRVLFGGEPR